MTETTPAIVEKYDRPLLFYTLATAIPWALWLAAAFLSHLEPSTPQRVLYASLLGLLGLLGPLAVALVMMLSNRALAQDFFGRLFNFRAARPFYWIVASFLMPTSILLAMALSLLFGYSPSQFQLAAHASFTSGIFSVWFLLIAAPIIEELAWHSYGTDCLRSRFNLFLTCVIFAAFWAVWHAPLALIKDYYQSNLIQGDNWDALNFPVSILPFVLIMNWLYYRTERNIFVAAIFHVTAGLFNELFATHPDSKIIQTGLLLVFATSIVIRERSLYFRRNSSDR